LSTSSITDSPAELLSLLADIKTIALVGASHKEQRPSHEVMSFLQAHNFRVIPVNPGLAGQELLGETVYENIEALSVTVDMVEIFRNSAAAGEICDQILTQPQEDRPKIVWMQIGVVNETAAEALRAVGIRVVMDQCPKRIIQNQ
jgi:uncharacterized protein